MTYLCVTDKSSEKGEFNFRDMSVLLPLMSAPKRTVNCFCFFCFVFVFVLFCFVFFLTAPMTFIQIFFVQFCEIFLHL